MTLDDKVRVYKELLDKKDELAELTKGDNLYGINGCF